MKPKKQKEKRPFVFEEAGAYGVPNTQDILEPKAKSKPKTKGKSTSK